MNVYISVDMEGVAGVVHEDQTNPVDPRCAAEYQRFRRLMTGEANAAIEGAKAAGAEKIWVNDSHWNMRNLLAEELDTSAELIAGDPKPWSMMQGIDGGFDAAFLVGYHARARTAGAILDHTYTDRVAECRINGRPLGELGINAALAGTWGVPVILVTGDSAVAREARELLGPSVETAVVKEAVSRHAARSLSPARSRRLIREAAGRALAATHAPFIIEPPLTLEVDFSSTAHADMAELLPGSAREAARTVVYRNEDMRELYRAWRAMYNLAAAAG